MKCIVLKNGGIVRVPDHIAKESVKKGIARYTNKQSWKAAKRRVRELSLTLASKRAEEARPEKPVAPADVAAPATEVVNDNH